MRIAELRNLTADELKVKEDDLRKELFNLKFQSVTGEIQNPMRIRAVRKEIARILTIVTEKQRPNT